MNCWRIFIGVFLASWFSVALVWAQNDKQFQARYWKEQPDQADVLTATFLGGKGDEWLVGGGIQSDGTIVLAGNVLGPTFELSIPIKVIGEDTNPPEPPKPVPQMVGKKQKTDKDGRPLFERPSWRHEGVTGFIVFLTPDLKKLRTAYRLPWTAGAITSAAVGTDGAIYLAGRATDRIVNLGGQVEEHAVDADPSRKDAACTDAFLAKLSTDGTKAIWVRRFKGPTDAPQVTVTSTGTIGLRAADYREYDANGKVLKKIAVPGGPRKTSSVSPLDDTIVVGGEYHSPTGREPWRCPTLNVFQPDGKLKYQLYDWGGPYVGLDNLRLVSDSAIRFVTHDRNGDILLYAWSDGGNSVMTREPFDVRALVRPRGLGITAAGAGVLSCAYLVHIDAKTFQVKHWTIWLAFSETNKPNSCWIDNLSLSENGSVLATGRAALGLWQSRNKLSDALPTGEYITVFTPDLTGIRYCSVVPGAGAAEVSYDKAGWGIVTGKVKGQERVLFVGSAVREVIQSGGVVATPTVNAGQPAFGGGAFDGYVVMLDLSKSGQPTQNIAPLRLPAAGPTTCSFERGAVGRTKTKSAESPGNQTFTLKPDVPKWVTVDAEFRDHAGTCWPSFLYGKPVEGSLTLKNNDLGGQFTVACTEAPQRKGDQARKVLAPLYVDGKAPVVRLSIESIGELMKTEITDPDAKKGTAAKSIEYRVGKGIFSINDRKIAVSPKITYNLRKTSGVWSGPGKLGTPVDVIHLNVWFTVKGSDLGLNDDGLIDVRFGLDGFPLSKD